MSLNQPYNEHELLLRIAKDDEQAFALFFYHTSPRIQLTIRQLVKTEAVTLDILQEVYIKAWLHRTELADMEYPVAWLKKIATNKSLNYLRRARLEADWLQKNEEGPEAAKTRIEGHLLARELQMFIHDAVSVLPQQRQAVYKLSMEEGLNRGEIARKLGLSEHTVKNHLALAKQTIREYLLKRGVLLWIIVAGLSF